jgi:hypothetical protein
MRTFEKSLLSSSMLSGRNSAAIGCAYARSGYSVSEDNQDLIPEGGLRDWHAATREWSEMSAVDRATAIQGLVARRRQWQATQRPCQLARVPTRSGTITCTKP